MNRDRAKAKELLPYVQAIADGKTVEWKYPRDTIWMRGVHSLEDLMVQGIELRIKPEPFECWVNVYDRDLDELHAHKTKEIAESFSVKGRTIHMRAVE